MKVFSRILDCKINESLSFKLNNKLIIHEQQILDLQDLFLSNGLHHIGVPSLKEGRRLIYKFLDALRCYYAPACFTYDKTGLRKSVFDMQKVLSSKDCDHFFIEEFNNDFLWIERVSNSYADCLLLEKKIRELHIDQHIPIIVLSLITAEPHN